MNQQLEKNEGKLKEKLSNYYDKEAAKLEKEIASFYQRYGKDNVIEYRTLLQTMSDADRTLLLERMKDFENKYPEYGHLLPTRENIYKLDRLEGLQQSIKMQQYEMGAIDNKELQKHLEKMGLLGADAMAKELGFGSNFYSMNPDIVKQFVNGAWANDRNFSDRIWNNRQKLADYLNNDFASGVARGDSYEKLMRNLRGRFGDVSRRDMYRLIYTEGTFSLNEGIIQPFIRMGFEEYQYSTADDGACDICKEMDGLRFPVSGRAAGIDFPPIHPFCRCSFIIVIPENFIADYEAKHGGNSLPDILKDCPKADTMKSKNDFSNFQEMKKYFNDTWNVNVNEAIGNLDFSAVKQSANGIVKVLEEFPQAQDTLKTLSISKSGVMCAGYNGDINFNPAYYDDISKLGTMIQGNTTGFHPKNTGLLETGSHEMGHILERTLSKKKNDGDVFTQIAEWGNCRQAKNVVSEACKAAKKTVEGKGLKNAELIEQVSGYAKRNRSETLAECVGDYVANGESASILSKEVWKILKRELG